MLSWPPKLVSLFVDHLVHVVLTLFVFATIQYTVSALLNVTSIYHDTLLAKIAKSDQRYQPLIPSSPHTRFTRAWSDKDVRYKWAARCLEVIKFVELLVEMGLRRTVSSKSRWRGIVLIEAIK